MRTFTRCGAALAALLVSGVCVFAQAPAAPSAQSSDPTDLVQQGRKLAQDGKQDEALVLYRQALKAAPDLAEAHAAAGVALDMQGQYAEARKHLQRAIDLAATPEAKQQAQRTMAMSYAFDKNAKQAIAFAKPVFDARLAKPDYPGAAEIANELARICLESGAMQEAHTWYLIGYQTALKKTDLTPAEQDLWNFRWAHAQARIAARNGDKTEADKQVALAKAVLDKGTNPEQASFFPYLTGYVAFYTGDAKTAIAELQKGNLKDPFILILLAQAYEKSGDKAQAQDYYKRVLTFHQHNPTNAFARPLAKAKVGAS